MKKRTNAKPLSRKDVLAIFQGCLTEGLKRNAYAKAHGLVPITLAVNFAKHEIPTVRIKDFGRKAENVIESFRKAARQKSRNAVARKSKPAPQVQAPALSAAA